MQRRPTRRILAAIAAAALGVAAFASPAAATHFTDVEGHEFFAHAAYWMEEQGLTTGVGGTLDEPSDVFEPFTIVDRAQLATFLWRMAGMPAPTIDDDGFTDTADDAYYTQAVRWLRERGYTTGIGGTHLEASTTFEPHTPVDRAQAITFLWRYGGQPTGSPDGDPASYPAHEFEDVPPATFYEGALRWAKAEGITTGYGGSHAMPAPNFEPHIPLTRGEMATLVWRYAGFPAIDQPGNTEEGAWVVGPPGPSITDAEITDAGTGIVGGVLLITYDEAVTCDNSVDAAEQFAVTFDADPSNDLSGALINCAFGEADEVQLVLEIGDTTGAEQLVYVESVDADVRITSADGERDAESPDGALLTA